MEAGFDEDVAALRRRAKTALGVGRGRLVDASGSACMGMHQSRIHFITH